MVVTRSQRQTQPVPDKSLSPSRKQQKPSNQKISELAHTDKHNIVVAKKKPIADHDANFSSDDGGICSPSLRETIAVQVVSSDDPYLAHFNREFTESEFDDSSVTSRRAIELVGETFVFEAPSNDPKAKCDILEDLNAHMQESVHPKIKNRLATEEPFCSLREQERTLLNLLTKRYCNLFDFNCGLNALHRARAVYTTHVMNHLLKGRAVVYANNARLKSLSERPGGNIPEIAATDVTIPTSLAATTVEEDATSCRDQGLVRPKVLILTPMRDSAFKIMRLVMSLFAGSKKGLVANRKKLVRLYYTPEDNRRARQAKKPADFLKIFHGNTDDCFRFGVQIGRRRMKVFSDFYTSDLIVASPLGLRMAMGGEEDKKWDIDFLSSLEIVVLDQADVFAMQNLEHMLFILENIHRRPVESHGVDFSRVRELSLDPDARGGPLVCQFLVFAAVNMPEIHSLVRKKSRNVSGSLISDGRSGYPAVASISGSLPQAFHKFSASSITHEANERFLFFFDKVFPSITDSQAMAGTLIVIPSYFDFVRVRNRLKTDNESFVQLCEYTEKSKMIRSRDMFFHGRKKLCLLTERLHFYRRYKIKGVRHVVFYQLPMYPNFYAEICNFIDWNAESTFHTCTVVYSKFDAFRLAGVLGSARAAGMLGSEKNVHMVLAE